MRIRIMLAASIATLAVAMLAGAAPSGADENVWGECPDGYTPTPFLAAPQDDRNGNGVVCVKFVGSHENTHDDPNGRRYRCNGFPTPPPECISDPEGSFYVLDDIVD
jgi:hypothetical protein